MFKILTITILFAMVVATEQISSYVETYIGEFYFQTPSVTGNFEDAKSWCSTNSSTLAVVRDNETQVALTQFLTWSQLNSPMYINMKLDKKPKNTWYIVNGSPYLGRVENQSNSAYNLYCYLEPNEKAEFLVKASNPSELRKYICDFEGSRCLNNSSNNLLFSERCYVKYEDESLSWYKARESCIDKGGDLARFQNRSNQWIPPFNTSWLNTSITYWVGIRYNNWSWKSADDDKEVNYTCWSNGKPNNFNYSCVCVDPKGNPASRWTDCDCSVQRPFACLKIFLTTTVITTTPTTTAVTSTATNTRISTANTRVTSTAPDVNPSNYSATSPGNPDNLPKMIGLGVGIGGGLFLILVVVIVVLVVIIIRRKRKSNGGSESRIEVESTGEDSNKTQHIQLAKSGGKDVDAVVNKAQRNPVSNEVYAAVVPNGKHQANKTDSPTDIIYSAPDFTQDPKSTPLYSNYEEAAPVRYDVHTLRGNTKSIFP